EWRHGAFYPKRLPAARMLRHYASVFRSVEINYTFRTMPTEAAIAGWREQTPDGFRFALKANQRITHMRRLHGAGPVLDEFTGLARLLGDRLGPVLFQLPPTLPYDAGLLTAFIDQLPDGLAAAFEFRHESWAAARPLLAQRGIALCVTETDETAVADDEL